MKKMIKNLSKNTLIKNILILTTGTASAQIISMLASPIITRMYGPEAYGIMGTFMALITIISPVAALTLPIAMVLPKHDKEAKEIAKVSVLITVTISIIIGITLLLFNKQLSNLFGLDEISSLLILLPLIVVFSGLLQILEQWLIRKRQFSVSARATFLQSIIINGGKIGVGFFYPSSAVLIILTSITNGLKAMLMVLFMRKKLYESLLTICRFKAPIKKTLKKYSDFPLYRAPENLLNAFSQSLPVLMLTSFFGPASAGFYSIGRTVLTIPSTLIGKSVGDVFYPRITEAAIKGEDLSLLIKKATLALAGGGIIPFGIVIAFGPFLFSFIFGAEWIVAGDYARWISLWMFFAFINQPSVRALPVISAQLFQLKFTTLMLIIRVLLLAIGYFVFSSDLIAIILFCVSGAILNVILILITIRKSKYFTNK